MKIENQKFTGERALFKNHDNEIINCVFYDGESPLKEGRNLKVRNCTFQYKYPLWYGENHEVRNCTFEEMSRSGIWYTNNSTFNDLNIIAPKEFRRCNNILLNDIVFHNAEETLWFTNNVKLKNIQADNGDYFLKDSKNVEIDSLKLNGNYLLDGGSNIVITNSILKSKDAFWNCNDVLVKNSIIEGEYIGWNSTNLRFVNCKIISHQGFCYINNLTIENCSIIDSDLIFEYCKNINASVNNDLLSVKNPISGVIKAKHIQTLIQDDSNIDISKVRIITND